MTLNIWDNPLLSIDDRLEVANAEIERLTGLLKKQRALSKTDETGSFMEWAERQPVELADEHLDDIGFWCWQAWEARAKLPPNPK